MSDEPTAMSNALRAFRDFRATFNEGDMVDEESGLTATDLDTAIEAMEAARRMVGIQYLDLGTDKGWDGLRRAAEKGDASG